MGSDRARRLVICVVLVTCIPSTGTLSSSSPDDQLLRREIPGFASTNENIFDALLRFGRQNHIPMGLVVSSGPCSTVLGEIKIGHTSVHAALELLIRELPAYTWKLDNGAVVITPKDLPGATVKFLDTKVAPYRISEDTLQAQAAYAWMDIRATLRPDQGTAFNILTSLQSTRWPEIAVGDITVLELLDRLVARGPAAAWILTPSDDPKKIAATRPFWVVDYSAAPPEKHLAVCSGPISYLRLVPGFVLPQANSPTEVIGRAELIVRRAARHV